MINQLQKIKKQEEISEMDLNWEEEKSKKISVFRACEWCTAGCRLKSAKGLKHPHVPSFCTLFNSIHRKNLTIPPEFAAQFKDQIREDLILEGPSGQIWTVSRDSEMNLVKGWDKFVFDHSLKEGEFLVFNLVDRSHFIVHIYDTDGPEKHTHFRIDVKQIEV
ncbi:hypothetical protein SUGI_0468650 [Cryptomeria japonica]|nr:hypothetical protein SUGI_0468650 [Cryptomeria japonica]